MRCACNGKEALDALAEMPRPLLILLDLMMPVMSGYELLQALRANDDLASIPVTVVSAVGDRLAEGTAVLRSRWIWRLCCTRSTPSTRAVARRAEQSVRTRRPRERRGPPFEAQALR